MPDMNSPEERRTRLRRWLVGVPLLLLLIGVPLTAVYLDSTGSQDLAEAMSAADRDDPYWRLNDLMAHRETVPDAENSALVLAKVIVLLPENWPRRAPRGSGVTTAVSTATADAFDRLDAIDENIRLDDAFADALRGELKAREEALAIARTVRDYGRGRHELVVGPAVIDTPLPETQAARSVARLLEADAAMCANDDDSDGALDSCRAIVATARSIGDEPTLISQLVRISIDRVAMKSARRVLGQGEPSDAALSRLQTLILDEHCAAAVAHRHEGRAGHADRVDAAHRSGGASALRGQRNGDGPFLWCACQNQVVCDSGPARPRRPAGSLAQVAERGGCNLA